MNDGAGEHSLAFILCQYWSFTVVEFSCPTAYNIGYIENEGLNFVVMRWWDHFVVATILFSASSSTFLWEELSIGRLLRCAILESSFTYIGWNIS